ncbi:hypothetical protein J437_LFUL015422 [Ladona fulva]|uniref:Elongation of very long chain fatty acids protein n=1 Tax=Ladona fulva TaxID=123851 RepID=A0A8K0KGX8_LADFU|nr:hypothetical protein J437_LFUL015422 [Ladona fulva]
MGEEGRESDNEMGGKNSSAKTVGLNVLQCGLAPTFSIGSFPGSTGRAEMAGAEGGALLDRIASYYHEVVYERDDDLDNLLSTSKLIRGILPTDERTRPWFLVASPWPILGLMAVYLLTVTKILPRFMANRKPYSLRGTLIGVNLFQIVANLWIGYEMLSSGWMKHYNILCQDVDYSRNPMAVREFPMKKKLRLTLFL